MAELMEQRRRPTVQRASWWRSRRALAREAGEDGALQGAAGAAARQQRGVEPAGVAHLRARQALASADVPPARSSAAEAERSCGRRPPRRSGAAGAQARADAARAGAAAERQRGARRGARRRGRAQPATAQRDQRQGGGGAPCRRARGGAPPAREPTGRARAPSATRRRSRRRAAAARRRARRRRRRGSRRSVRSCGRNGTCWRWGGRRGRPSGRPNGFGAPEPDLLSAKEEARVAAAAAEARDKAAQESLRGGRAERGASRGGARGRGRPAGPPRPSGRGRRRVGRGGGEGGGEGGGGGGGGGGAAVGDDSCTSIGGGSTACWRQRALTEAARCARSWRRAGRRAVPLPSHEGLGLARSCSQRGREVPSEIEKQLEREKAALERPARAPPSGAAAAAAGVGDEGQL